MPMCCSPTCTREATVALRVLPRRTVTPLCPCVARGLVWPGVDSPVTLHACPDKSHQKAIRNAAKSVIAAQVLGEAAAAVRVAEDT